LNIAILTLGTWVRSRGNGEELLLIAKLEEIRDVEGDFIDADDAIRLYQELVDTGLVWHLSERYQRIARTVLEGG
jgi:hypothetical protein